MVHAALLLLMLEAANADPRFTISLKRSTQKSSDIHKLGRPITPSLRGKAEVEGGAALAALRHRDIDAPDLALGADLHRLLVAGGPQRHAGGKSRSLDEHLDLATARRALQSAENIPARFAPVAGDAVTLARNVGTQVEFVAVAGATEKLLHPPSRPVDILAGLASYALTSSLVNPHLS